MTRVATDPDRERPLRRATVPSWPSVAEQLTEQRRRLIVELVGESDGDRRRERRPDAPRPV